MKSDTWNVAGAMVNMGNMAQKALIQYNLDVDLYGYHSKEAIISWIRFIDICNCVRSYKGFDLCCKVYDDDTRKIQRIWITYNREQIGIPWEIKK